MESAAALTVRRKPYPNINILFAGQQIVPCDGIIFICKTNESKCFRVADTVMYLHVGRGFLSASITWKVNCLGACRHCDWNHTVCFPSVPAL